MDINERAQQIRAEQHRRAAEQAAKEAQQKQTWATRAASDNQQIQQLAKQFATWARRNNYPSTRDGWFGKRGWRLIIGTILTDSHSTDWEIVCFIAVDGSTSLKSYGGEILGRYDETYVGRLQQKIAEIVAATGTSWP